MKTDCLHCTIHTVLKRFIDQQAGPIQAEDLVLPLAQVVGEVIGTMGSNQDVTKDLVNAFYRNMAHSLNMVSDNTTLMVADLTQAVDMPMAPGVH